MLTNRNLLIAIALNTTALLAQANSFAQLTVSGFGYQLSDLNAADGLAPSLELGSWGPSVLQVIDSRQLGWLRSPAPNSETKFVYSAQFAPGSGFVTSRVRDDATLSSDLGLATSEVIKSSGGFGALVTQAKADAGQLSFAYGQANQSFVLGAGTRVTFSVQLDASMAGAAAPIQLPRGSSARDSHAAGQFLSLLRVGSLLASEGATHNNDFNGLSAAFADGLDSKLLQLTVDNTSSEPMTLALQITAQVSAQELTAPIPEPSTYALMALGLLGVGAATRRQRRG